MYILLLKDFQSFAIVRRGIDDSIILTQEPSNVIFIKVAAYFIMVLKVNH